jgi:haloalkane dehalogenase
MTTPARPGWVPTRLYPFGDRYVQTDGAAVHYVDEGTGPTLLFLHGNPTWSFLYREIIIGLRSEYRCVALGYLASGCRSTPPATGSPLRSTQTWSAKSSSASTSPT